MILPAPELYSDWKEWARALNKLVGEALDRKEIPIVEKAQLGDFRKVRLALVKDADGGPTLAISNGTGWVNLIDGASI